MLAALFIAAASTLLHHFCCNLVKYILDKYIIDLDTYSGSYYYFYTSVQLILLIHCRETMFVQSEHWKPVEGGG